MKKNIYASSAVRFLCSMSFYFFFVDVHVQMIKIYFFLSTCQYNISRSTHTIPNTVLFMTHSIMKLANHFRTLYLQSCFIILMRYINETFNSFGLDELLEQKKKYNSTNELFISNQ